jgi:hypothetical protein
MYRRASLLTALFTILAMLMLPARASAQDPAPGVVEEEAAPEETPLEMAQRYTDMLMVGDAGTAVDYYWDLDAIFKAAFGEHLKRLQPAEYDEMKQLMRDFLQRHNGSPRNLAVLKMSKYEDFRVRERSGTPKTALITYNLVIAKKERVLTSLIVRLTEGRWRVIDGGVAGKMIVSQMRAEYKPRAEQMTPLEYSRAMIKAVNARSGEASITPE